MMSENEGSEGTEAEASGAAAEEEVDTEAETLEAGTPAPTAEELAAEEAPTEETPLEDDPTEIAPAQESPAAEAPAETPAQEAPAAEAPPAAAAAPAAASDTPRHLWGIGIVAVLWNCMGCFDYLMTQTRNEAYMGRFSPELLAWLDAIPSWVHATWALGVWGGLLGSVLLLMRKSLAVPVFIVSVVGMLITQAQNYFVAGALDVMGTGGAIFTVVIICIGVGLLLYARAMSQRGVLS